LKFNIPPDIKEVIPKKFFGNDEIKSNATKSDIYHSSWHEVLFVEWKTDYGL